MIGFREDVLKALTDLNVENLALREALIDRALITKDRLDDHRKTATEHRGKILDKYAQSIRSV